MNANLSMLTAAAISACAIAPASQATSVLMDPFDPDTYFDGNFLAGLDFDDDTDGSTEGLQLVTESGFTSVAPSNSKSYTEVSNGVTFGIEVTNANLGNQNRWRGATNFVKTGALMNDFEQWFGDTGTAVEAAITLSGLTSGLDYEITTFHFNVGAGQTTHSFYDGSSSAAPLLDTIGTSGNQNNYATWQPGVLTTLTADASGEIVFTIQATVNETNNQSRLTLAGISVFTEDTGPAVPGDTDGDGDIDDSDLGTSFSNYTGPVGAAGGKTAAEGDTDGDGDVDDSDLGTSFSGYTGPLGPASVPEPTSLALLGLGGLAMIRRRRA